MSTISTDQDLALTAGGTYSFYASAGGANLSEDNGSGYEFKGSINSDGRTFVLNSGNVRISPSGTVNFNYHVGKNPVVVVNVSATAAQVTLDWEDYEGNFAYELERSLDKVVWTSLTTTASDDVDYVDTDVTAGTQYYYRIRPVITGTTTSVLWSPVVGILTPTTSGGGASIDPPTGFSVTETTPISATIAWTDPGDGEVFLTLQRSTDQTNWSIVGHYLPGVESVLDDNLSSGTQHFYRLMAFGDNGDNSTYVTGDVTLSTPVVPLSGQILWLEPDNYNATSGIWTDSSAAGNNYAQGTGADKPAIQSAWANSEDGVIFDGVNDSLENFSMPGIMQRGAEGTYIIVASRAAQNNSQCLSTFISGTLQFSLRTFNSTTMHVWRGGNTQVFDSQITDQVYVYIVRTSSIADITRETDTFARTTALDGTGTTASLTNWRLGNDRTAGAPWEGTVGDVLAYDRALTDTEADQVMTYLKSKYGVA